MLQRLRSLRIALALSPSLALAPACEESDEEAEEAEGPGSWGKADGLPQGPEGSSSSVEGEVDLHGSAVLPDGRIFMVAAYEAYIYDPATGVVSSLGEPPISSFRGAPTVVVLEDGRVWVAAACPSQAPTYLYDPAANAWSESPRRGCVDSVASQAVALDDARVLLNGRHLWISNVDDGTAEIVHHWRSREGESMTRMSDGTFLLIGGGEVGSIDVSVFDPTTSELEILPPLQIPRTHHTATLLEGGRVLVAGGDSLYGPTATAEIYDPITGTSVRTENLASARSLHDALLLEDGRVAVVGGSEPASGATPLRTSGRIELFDPGEEAWTFGAALRTPRREHAAYEVAAGELLVTGGWHQSTETGGSDRVAHEVERVTLSVGAPQNPAADRPGSLAFVPVRSDGERPRYVDTTAMVDGAFYGLTQGVDSDRPSETYRYAAGQWELVADGESSPLFRTASRMVHDVQRDRLVVFGGRRRTNFLYDDTWEFDGTTWEEIVPAGERPTSREHHAMAYAEDLGLTVVIGGNGPQGVLSDVWGWDGTAWTQLPSPTTGPLAARQPNDRLDAVYDPERGRIIVTAGQGERFEVWSLHPQSGTWTQLDTPYHGDSNLSTRLFFDEEMGRTRLYGRFGTRHRIHTLEGSEWEEVSVDADGGVEVRYDALTHTLTRFLEGELALLRDLPGANHAPTLTSEIPDEVRLDPLEAYSLMVDAIDDDGDPITLSAVGLPIGASFDASTGALSWTPSNEQTGDYEIELRATTSDGVDHRHLRIAVYDSMDYAVFPAGEVALETSFHAPSAIEMYRLDPIWLNHYELVYENESFPLSMVCEFTGNNPGVVRYMCRGRFFHTLSHGQIGIDERWSGVVAEDGSFGGRGEHGGYLDATIEEEDGIDYLMRLTNLWGQWRDPSQYLEVDLEGERTSYLDRIPGH